MGLKEKKWDSVQIVGLACFNVWMAYTLLGAGTEKFVPRIWNTASIPPPWSMVKQAFIGAPNIHFRAGKNSGLTRTTPGNFFKRSMEKTYLIWKVRGGGGILRVLTKKSLTHIVFAFPGPPCIQPTFMDKISFYSKLKHLSNKCKGIIFCEKLAI